MKSWMSSVYVTANIMVSYQVETSTNKSALVTECPLFYTTNTSKI